MPRASSRNRQLVPDLLAPGLDLVFCGTAPSPASFKARAYYANPGNAFWPTLNAVGLTPERFSPDRYPELLTLGIGLTDLNKTKYGSDHELSAQAMDARALHAKLRAGIHGLGDESVVGAVLRLVEIGQANYQGQQLGIAVGREPFRRQADGVQCRPEGVAGIGMSRRVP